MKLGIPRALGYYHYFPFWHGFFSALGIEVILSDKTTKQIVSNGSALVVSETCLPVKVYAGHILNLLDKGVDTIYCPSIQSIAPKIYNCSKIRGIPDLIRNVVKKDFLMIEPTLDKSEKNQGLYEYLMESVAPLGITDIEKVKKASKAGWQCMNNFTLMTRSGIDYQTALKNAITGKVVIKTEETEYPIKVAVIGHAYNVYDEHASMRILNKLKKMGVKAYTAENITIEQMEKGLSTLDTELYWANEMEISGAAGHFLTDSQIDGIISLAAFGCGPDSLMIERMTRYAKRLKKPLLNLTTDEHTGEAGFITRIEAFTDMLFRKKRAALTKRLENQENYDLQKASETSNSEESFVEVK